MKNQVIKVLSEEHGMKVIKYWESKGIPNPHNLCGNSIDTYYGIIDGKIDFRSHIEYLDSNTEIITLPEEKTFPRKMLVWDGNENNAFETYVFIELSNKADYRYIGVNQYNIKKYEQGENYEIGSWAYAKELPEVNTKKQELLNKADELRNKLNEIEEQIKDL